MSEIFKQCRSMFFALVVALLLLGLPVVGQVGPKNIELSDVFEFEFATDPQISPDGRSVVYVRNYFDIMTDRQKSDLWVVGENLSNQPFLPDSKYENPHSPVWSPDGKKLAFVTRDLNGNAQIFVFWVETGRVGRLTKLTQSPNDLAWSPDGDKLAFFMHVAADDEKPFAKLPAKPNGAKWADPPKVIQRTKYRSDGQGYLPFGFTHLFVISAEGGTPRQLTDGEFNHGGGIAWSVDARSIVISANRHENWEDERSNTELYSVSLGGGVTQLTDRNGSDSEPSISGDGKTIAYTGFDDKLLGYHNNELYVKTDGGVSRNISGSLDRSLSSPVWNPATGNWLITYSDQGNTILAEIDGAGKIRKLASDLGSNATGRPYGGVGPVSVSRNGTIAFPITTPEHPGDVAVLTPQGTLHRLTNLNADLLESRKLGKVTEVIYKSGFDGRNIQGWYIAPPDFDPKKKYPLLLEIHGGPFADYGDRFSAELQLYAAAGYVVLYTNPRGSTSYGAEFANLIHQKYPGNDYDDLMSGVDSMISKGFIDQDELYVTGGSGGGVLTAWIVGMTDRFKAAVVAKPVINWYSFVLYSDNPDFYYKYWFPGLPWENLEHYMKRSPISLVGNVKTPTMLLTGESDLRTPISESEQYYAALKLRKVDTAMVRIPGAYHGIAARPSQLMAKVGYILAWFEKYRGKGAP